MKSLLKGIALLCIISLAKSASSQIVNIEEYRISTDSVGWAGSADASLFLNKNNDFLFSILTNAQIQHKRPKTLWLLINDMSTVQANEQDAFVNAGFLHFRMNYKLSDRFVIEAFSQGLFNGPLGVKWKLLNGAGLRYKVIGSKKFRLYVASLYMQETERNIDATENLYFNRMSNYISLTWEPAKNSRISNTTYYQPVIKNFSDYRIASNTSIKAFLTKAVYLELEYNLFLDTAPPANTPGTVYTLKSGIGVEF